MKYFWISLSLLVSPFKISYAAQEASVLDGCSATLRERAPLLASIPTTPSEVTTTGEITSHERVQIISTYITGYFTESAYYKVKTHNGAEGWIQCGTGHSFLDSCFQEVYCKRN